MNYLPTYNFITPTILEFVWPKQISESILLDMLVAKEKALEYWSSEVIDATMGYHCLSLRLKRGYQKNEIESFLSLLKKANSITLNRKRWFIPVLYNGHDLERVSELTGLNPTEIISLHQRPEYLLHFYGFMPGFMYLGGLPKELFAPRKSTPDPVVEKGSVAIGGKQTGIYPMDSPGGWNIIGKTPIQLFNINNTPPTQPKPGDIVKFQSVDNYIFNDTKLQVDNNAYSLKHEPY